MRAMLTAGSGLALGLFCLPVWADPGMPNEEDFLGELPVVLSATRLSQPRSDAPASITVIDRAMIEASGAQSIPELFRLVPGFQVGHDTNDLLSADPIAVTYHGLSNAFARGMQVLVDGRSIYSPDFGGVQWHSLALDVDDIERIEIIRGPNGAAYGVNAFMAVINIITRSAAESRGLALRATMGTNGERQSLVRYGAVGTNLDMSVSIGFRSDEGHGSFFDSKQLHFASIRGEYRLNDRDTFNINLGQGGGPHQAGAHPIAAPLDNPMRTVQRDGDYQQIMWRRVHSTDSETRIQYYRNYHDYRDAYWADLIGATPLSLPDGIPETIINQSIVVERQDIEFQNILRLGSAWRLVWGFEGRWDAARAPQGWFYGMAAATNTLYRAFSNAEWQPSKRWTINLGLMGEHNESTGLGYSPRIGLNYRLGTGRTLRASYSHGQRTPALLERYANAVLLIAGTPVTLYNSAPGMRPECIKSYEIGYLYESDSRRSSIDIRLYQDIIDDLIVYPIDALSPFFTATFMNGGFANIRGAEFEWRWRPGGRGLLSFSYAYAEQTGSFISGYSNTPLGATYVWTSTGATTPRHTLNLLGAWPMGERTTASLNLSHVSPMAWFEIVTNVAPAYNKLDVRVAHALGGEGGSRIEFVAQNLAGTFTDFTKGVTFDRRYYVVLRMGLK